MGKSSRSFSIDDGLLELMGERNDVNWSGLVNTFLQEYAAGGKGTEAALAVRLERVEDDIQEYRMKLEKAERERDRIQAILDEKEDKRRDVFEAFERYADADLGPSNGVVKNHAEKLGMTPDTFLRKFEEWSQ